MYQISSSSMSATKISPFLIRPENNAYPRNIPGKTFVPNSRSPDWSFAEIGKYSTIAPKGVIGPLIGSPNRLFRCFPTCQEVLNFSQIAIAFHGISPPFFIQARSQQYLQTFLLLFCEPHIQPCHLSRIDRMLKHDDSMINLHKSCQIPTNCQCK